VAYGTYKMMDLGEMVDLWRIGTTYIGTRINSNDPIKNGLWNSIRGSFGFRLMRALETI